MTGPAASPFSAELEALHTAARADLDAAATSHPTNRAAWRAQVADARRTLANIYRLAMDDVPAHSLTWHALREAAQRCDAHVNRLLDHPANSTTER
jgi:hypothetical protein